jgi:hypothetical protein
MKRKKCRRRRRRRLPLLMSHSLTPRDFPAVLTRVSSRALRRPRHSCSLAPNGAAAGTGPSAVAARPTEQANSVSNRSRLRIMAVRLARR